MLERWRKAWAGRVAALAAFHCHAGRRALTRALGGWTDVSLRRWQRQQQLVQTFAQFRCLLVGWQGWQDAAAAARAERLTRARLEECRGAVAARAVACVRRRFLAVWKEESALRKRATAAAGVAARCHKRRTLAAWAVAAAVGRRGRSVAARSRHYLGREALRRWLGKAHKRRLLRRVFAVQVMCMPSLPFAPPGCRATCCVQARLTVPTHLPPALCPVAVQELTYLLHLQRLGSPAQQARTLLHAWRAVALGSAQERRREEEALREAEQAAAADAFRAATLTGAPLWSAWKCPS